MELTPDVLLTVVTIVWPVADPFVLALWPGALSAAALHQPAHFDGDLGLWAERCQADLPGWTTRGRS